MVMEPHDPAAVLFQFSVPVQFSVPDQFSGPVRTELNSQVGDLKNLFSKVNYALRVCVAAAPHIYSNKATRPQLLLSVLSSSSVQFSVPVQFELDSQVGDLKNLFSKVSYALRVRVAAAPHIYGNGPHDPNCCCQFSVPAQFSVPVRTEPN
jgi:hypothetical protein